MATLKDAHKAFKEATEAVNQAKIDAKKAIADKELADKEATDGAAAMASHKISAEK